MNSLAELDELGKERKQMPEMGADKEPKKEDTISLLGNLNKRNIKTMRAAAPAASEFEDCERLIFILPNKTPLGKANFFFVYFIEVN